MTDALQPADAPEPDEAPASAPAEAATRPEAAEVGAAPLVAASLVTPLPGRVAYGLATLSGLLYFVAFPGIDVWPLTFIALVPLIVAMRGQSARRAAGLGWMAGFTMTMTGFYWLLEMLKVFSGFPIAACIFFMAVLCAYQGGRIALAGWLYGRAANRGWPAAPVFAVAFAASELVYPLLFPWYYGATVHKAPVLMQVADLGGPILVGLVLVATNLALAELVLARRERRSRDLRLLAVGVAAPVLAALYGVLRIHLVEADMAKAETVKVGIVQGNMPLFDRKRAIGVYTKRTKELRDQGAELVVWSEAAVSRSFQEATYETDLKTAVTKDLKVPTIIGGVLVRPGDRKVKDSRTTYFNTALFADENGDLHGRYDKQFLLAFGEYLPFGDTFPVLYKWSPNSGNFTAGKSIEPLIWGKHRIGVLICYEDIIPSFVNKVVRHSQPDLLVNLTNDAWFGDSTEPWIHMALSKLRSAEHHRYLVRGTNSGVSVIIDPVGRVVVHGGTFREETLLGEARFMTGRSVYQLIGDVPWWAATLAVVTMAFVRRRGSSGPPAPGPAPRKEKKKLRA